MSTDRWLRQRFLPALVGLTLSLSLAWGSVSAAAPPTPAAADSSWVRLASPLAPGGTVLDLAVGPSAPEKIFALLDGESGSRLYRSQDAALTWGQVYTFTQHITNLTVDPAAPDTLYAGGNDGIYRTSDSGVSWIQIYTLGQVVSVVSSTQLYAGGSTISRACVYTPLSESRIARSDDGGVSWQTASLGCRGDIEAIAVDPDNPLRLYTATALDPYRDTHQIWGSQDGGQTWQGLLSPPPERLGRIYSLEIDPLAPQHIYYNSISRSGVSMDGGQTWQRLDGLPVAPVSIAFSGGSLYAAPLWSGGKFYRSEDGGQTWWQSLNSLPQGVTVLSGVPGQPEVLYAGLFAYGVWRSSTRGSGWREFNQGLRSPTGVTALAADPADPLRLLAGSIGPRPGLFESRDGGLNWTLALTDTPVIDIAVHPLTATIVYAGTPGGIVFTTDGSTWGRDLQDYFVWDVAFTAHALPQALIGGYRNETHLGYVAHFHPDVSPPEWGWDFADLPGAETIRAVAGDSHAPDTFFAAGVENPSKGAGIWRSQDGGHDWEQVFSYPSAPEFRTLLVDPLRPGWVYAAGIIGFYVSQDGGDSWQAFNTGLPWFTNAIVQDEMGLLYTGNEHYGVFHLPPGQAAWVSFGLDESINDLVARPGPAPALYAGGWDGIWRRDLPPVYRLCMPLIQR